MKEFEVSHTCAGLRQLCRRLRDPGGCDWDRAQTLSSITPYLLEETHEVLEAIASEEPERLREELGDLLYLIVFAVTMAEERGDFDFPGVIARISEKLIRRHPHVFGEPLAPEERGRPDGLWEAAKRKEKQARGDRRGLLASGAAGLPALLEAFRVQEKAAGFGFDWPDIGGVLAKIDEERAELAAALADERPPARGGTGQAADADAPARSGSGAAVHEEIGDLLFSLVNLARHHGDDPEQALKSATRKFQERFSRMEEILRARGTPVGSTALDEMEAAWQEAKQSPSGPGPRSNG